MFSALKSLFLGLAERPPGAFLIYYELLGRADEDIGISALPYKSTAAYFYSSLKSWPV